VTDMEIAKQYVLMRWRALPFEQQNDDHAASFVVKLIMEGQYPRFRTRADDPYQTMMGWISKSDFSYSAVT